MIARPADRSLSHTGTALERSADRIMHRDMMRRDQQDFVRRVAGRQQFVQQVMRAEDLLVFPAELLGHGLGEPRVVLAGPATPVSMNAARW